MSGDRGNDGGGAVQRVATELRNRIVAHTYPPNGSLPPQHVLAAEFHVSRDTVQRALQELKDDGWIESRRGSGSRVTKVRQGTSAVDGTSRMRTAELGWFIERAFTQAKVELDVYSLTSESLETHLRVQAEGILAGSTPGPELIKLRMLLPVKDMALPFPRSLDDPEDRSVLERLWSISDRCIDSLRETLQNLQANGKVGVVDLQVRRVPVAPMFKLYLLNRKEAFHSAYKLQNRKVPLTDKGSITALDILSVGAVGTYFTKDDTADDAQSAWVEREQLWFDSVWQHLAE